MLLSQVVDNSLTIKKGTNPNVDSYSAFWDNMKLSKTKLEEKLTELGVTDVYICGIAYDVCVGELFLLEELRFYGVFVCSILVIIY